MAYKFSLGPGTGPINWSLRATQFGEIHTPFAHYVQLDPQPHCANATFAAFAQLPIELQIHVLRFCSSGTLFQLMQASAVLRREASKLFWSDPNAWYWVDGAWLLAGGFPGDANYVPDFGGQVQQIEVHSKDLEYTMLYFRSRGAESEEKAEEESEEGSEGEVCVKQKEQIRDFWRSVQYRFPQVVRAIISGSRLQRPGPLLPDIYQQLAQGCPSGVSVFVSEITMHASDKNWRFEHHIKSGVRYRAHLEHGRWEFTDSAWERQIILPPPKAFRGPVGEYAQYRYQINRYGEMMCGTKLLLIEAIERNRFNGQQKPFRCPGFKIPRLRCQAYFERSGEWPMHAVATGHYVYLEVPEELREVFAKHEQMVELGQKENAYGPLDRMRGRWERAESQERREIQQTFVDQLQHDPQYAVSGSIGERTWEGYEQTVEW